MKINHSVNTTIITDNNEDIISQLENELIITDINQAKRLTEKFVVFNDVLRYLKKKDFSTLLNIMEDKDIHFLNITSDIEEALFSDELIVFDKGKIILEGSTISVLKEERILKKLGYKLPFIIDLSLQLNAYGIIDSIFLDEELLVDKIW